MSSCSYLDPASLLAQSVVSIRLGRRASTCSHTLLATARRAPLNESSVQGSLKQSSTAVSAPTQVFQSVGVNHLGRHAADCEDPAVDRLLPPRNGEPRRRHTLPVGDSALQIAVSSPAGHAVEELTPSVHLEAAVQHPTEAPQDPDVSESMEVTQHSMPTEGARRSPTLQLGAEEGGFALEINNDYDDQRNGHQRHLPPESIFTSALQAGGQRGPRHQSLLTSGRTASAKHPTFQSQSIHPLTRSNPPSSDWGQGGGPLMPVTSTVSTAVATAVANPGLDPAVGHDIVSPIPNAAAVATVGILGGSTHEAWPSQPPITDAKKGSATASSIVDGSRAPQVGMGHLTDMPPPPDGPPTFADDLTGARWGGLGSELEACRSIHSVQRFLQLMGRRVKCELMGNAIIHLSHLVAEEPPDSEVERQLLAGLLDDLMQRLSGSARQLSPGMLVALVCAMSRLRCYNGLLLRELAAVAREAATELTTRQSAGLFWAFGRYHRDFSFRLEPGWAAALLQGSLPRLPQAKPQEVAMLLYGSALLREPPPAAVLAVLLAASLAGLPAAGGPELSMSIWALATLRLHPGREWMQAFLERCDTATRTFVSGAAVSNVLYGLASMRVQPPAPWMLNFLWQAQRRLNTMDAQSLVMLGWALGRMRYRPDRKWLSRFFRYTRSAVLQKPQVPHIPTLFVQQLRALSMASQSASQRPLDLWRLQQQRLQKRHQLPQQRRRTHDTVHVGDSGASATALPPQAYNVLLWVCVRLSCRPMGHWLPQLCETVQPGMASWPPHELSALLWGLSRLRWRPHDEWMTEFCAAARSGLSGFQPSDCVMTLLALSKLCSGLGYRVSDGELANAVAQRLSPYYSRLQTTTLISVLLAIARVTPRVRPARLEEALSALLDRVRAIGVVSNTGAEVSSGRGAVDNPDAGDVKGDFALQQEEMEPEPEPLLGMQAPMVSLRGLGRPQYSDPQSAHLLQAPTSPTETSAQLPPLTARECANAVFTVGCVAVLPSYNDTLRGLCAQLLRELLPLAFRLTPIFNCVDLVLLIHGVAMSRVRVSPQWLRRHEEQAVRRLRSGELRPGQLRELHRAYHALDYTPELLPARLPLESAALLDEEGGSWFHEAPTAFSEAAKARRRRAAQMRRRRVTAAIERRVAEARQQAVEAGLRRNIENAAAVVRQDVTPLEPSPMPHITSSITTEGPANATRAPDVSNELDATERELKLRLQTIRRFTVVARRRRQSSWWTSGIANDAANGTEGAAGGGESTVTPG